MLPSLSPNPVSLLGPLLLHDSPASGLPSGVLMIPIMLAIFYFVLWRPQQQEQKEQQKLIAGLQRGDKVVTTGGIHGTVWEAKDATLVLEISKDTYMTVDRDTVKRKVTAVDSTAPTAKAGK